ncbi:MAG: peptidylprolyl isomerase [Planctomycetota bacterium JB042]
MAPATSLHIAELIRNGFYDGITFHRTIKGFMIQAGCPEGTGGGGPGYSIEAEFNAKPHVAGVFSMARVGDPYERMGRSPRPQFANSAGSQFFLCDATASALDRKYTAFGKVVEGLDVVHAIAAAPAVVAGEPSPSKPVDPVVIEKASLVLEEAAPAADESEESEETDG